MIDDSFITILIITILNYHNRMFEIKINRKIVSRGFCTILYNMIRFEVSVLLGYDMTSMSDRVPTRRDG